MSYLRVVLFSSFLVESNCSHATSEWAHATLLIVRGAPTLRRTLLGTFAGTTGASQADNDASANTFAAGDVTAARAAAGARSLFFFLGRRMPMPFARGIAHLSTHGAKSAHTKRTRPIQCTADGLPQAHYCAVRLYAHALLSVQHVPGACAMGSSWPHFRLPLGLLKPSNEKSRLLPLPFDFTPYPYAPIAAKQPAFAKY